MANIFTDAWFWVTTGKTASAIEAETAKNNETLARLDADLIARGIWDSRAIRDSANQRGSEDYALSPGKEVASAAAEGAVEGLANVADSTRGFLNTATGGALSTFWRALPWWVWLAILAYVTHSLGIWEFPKLTK